MMLFRRLLFFALLLCLGVCLSLPTVAAQTSWSSVDYVQARLVSAVKATGQEAQIKAGLELQLEDGWHAYWRMPGDGGLPPHFNWDRSVNIVTVKPAWPVPQRFETMGLYSFGYEDRVLLPLTVYLSEAGEAAALSLDADIMVCNQICVPQKISLDLQIPSGVADPSSHATLITTAQGTVPQTESHPALKIESMVIGPDALVVRAFSQKGYEAIDLFVETDGFYVTAPPDVTLDDSDPRYATLKIVKPENVDNLASQIMKGTVTVTLVKDDLAIEKSFSF